MTDKRVSGAAKRLRGSVIEALGKLTGDQSAEARGAAQKQEGTEEAKSTKNSNTKNIDGKSG